MTWLDTSTNTEKIVERVEYDIYGKATFKNWGADRTFGTGDDATASTSLVGNPFLFTGQRYDPETGNYYYKMRYFSPNTGRFLSQDPFEYINGPNMYQYCGSMPLKFVDPMGLGWKDWALGAIEGACVGAAAGFALAALAVASPALATVAAVGATAYGCYRLGQLIRQAWDGDLTTKQADSASGHIIGGLAGGYGASQFVQGCEITSQGPRAPNADDVMAKVNKAVANRSGPAPRPEPPPYQEAKTEVPGRVGNDPLAEGEAAWRNLQRGEKSRSVIERAKPEPKSSSKPESTDPRCASNPAKGRVDNAHDSYHDALKAAQERVGNLGKNSEKMYDPETGTLIGERTAGDKGRGWRIDDDHVNWWDWSGGKRGSGGAYGHDYYPKSQSGPHSKGTNYAPWEADE